MERITAIEKVLKFITTNFDIIIIAILNILGWLLMHWLNMKRQKRDLFLQIKNDARIKIVTALRDYQDWLYDVKDIIYEMQLLKHETHIKRKCKAIEGKIINLTGMESIICKWILYIEEYMGLFPIGPSDLQRLLNEYDYSVCLLTTVKNHLKSIYFKDKEIDEVYLNEKLVIVMQKIRLINDLIICYQNLYLEGFDEYKTPVLTGRLSKRVSIKNGLITIKVK